MGWLPADFGDFFDRLGGEFRGRDVDEHGGAGIAELQDLRIDRRIGGFIGHVSHNVLPDRRETFLYAIKIVTSHVVILTQNGDLGGGFGLQDPLGENRAFGVVVRRPAHGPRELLGVGPFRRAGSHKQLRHLLLVHILMHGGIGLGAQAVEHQQHLIAFDQLAGQFDCLRRTVAIIQRDEIDLATIHTALVVYHPEIGRLRPPGNAIGRRIAAIGHGLADFYFGVRHTGAIFVLGQCRTSYRS